MESLGFDLLEVSDVLHSYFQVYAHGGSIELLKNFFLVEVQAAAVHTGIKFLRNNW